MPDQEKSLNWPSVQFLFCGTIKPLAYEKSSVLELLLYSYAFDKTIYKDRDNLQRSRLLIQSDEIQTSSIFVVITCLAVSTEVHVYFSSR